MAVSLFAFGKPRRIRCATQVGADSDGCAAIVPPFVSSRRIGSGIGQISSEEMWRDTPRHDET